jgi:hypothetical protein
VLSLKRRPAKTMKDMIRDVVYATNENGRRKMIER